jgi:hypothetical protein
VGGGRPRRRWRRRRRRGLFARAAKAQIKAPAELADQVEALLKSRLLSGLGLAKRGGDLISGFEKVSSAISVGQGTRG